MTFTVIGGSMLVAYLLTLSRIPFFLADTITALNAPPLLILALIILSLCFLGAFFPNIPLLLICVPIFLPVAKMYQWDLIWFGVLMVLVFNMAAITPPFGHKPLRHEGPGRHSPCPSCTARPCLLSELFFCASFCAFFFRSFPPSWRRNVSKSPFRPLRAGGGLRPAVYAALPPSFHVRYRPDKGRQHDEKGPSWGGAEEAEGRRNEGSPAPEKSGTGWGSRGPRLAAVRFAARPQNAADRGAERQ